MHAKELHFSANRFFGQDLWIPEGAVTQAGPLWIAQYHLNA